VNQFLNHLPGFFGSPSEFNQIDLNGIEKIPYGSYKAKVGFDLAGILEVVSRFPLSFLNARRI